MLVVSRKPGERLLIGEAVQVTILEIRGDQVRLGVSAPREVPIHREELLERIRRENRRAAVLGSEELQSMGARLRNSLSPPTPAAGSPDHAQPEPAPPKDAAEAARAS
jgi:carbon storage regulator